ncbi:hypothetical protein LTR17_018446, partial [Elasticomyces elasticus]
MADHLAAFPLSSHPLNDSYDSTPAPPDLRSGHTQRYTAPTQTQQRSLYKVEPNNQQGHPTPVSGSIGPSGGRNANALSDSGNDLSNGGYQVPDDSTGMCSTRSSMDTVSYERLEEGLLQQSRDTRAGLALRGPATTPSHGHLEGNGQPRPQLPTRASPHRWPFMDEPHESYVQAQDAATGIVGPTIVALLVQRPANNGRRRPSDGGRRCGHQGKYLRTDH